MMQPPAPMAAAPQMMQPPAGQFGHQPPPLGQFQPPAPQQPHAQLNQQGAASPFYGQQPSAQQMQRAVAPGASSAPGGMPAPFQENIDYSIQIPERLCLFTAKKIPQTAGMATSSKVPIGGILRPLAPAACEEDEVDVVQPGNAGIIRCKRYVIQNAASGNCTFITVDLTILILYFLLLCKGAARISTRL